MKFNEYLSLQEGVNDPAIFKVIFLAGGPGSGKSFMVKKTALQAMGFTVINSDNAFEHLLKKNNLSMKMPESEKEQRDLARDAAKETTNKKQDLALQGRLGMVIDGTGRDYDKIKKLSAQFQKQGYDTSMIFVNTDLETALDRNAKRDRSVPDEMAKKLWMDVQGNIGKFQSEFGNNFHVVDNSEGADFDEQTNRVFKDIGKWSKQPPKNNVAKKWIDSQKGGKSDAKETPAKKQSPAAEETPAPKSDSKETPPVAKEPTTSEPKEAPPVAKEPEQDNPKAEPEQTPTEKEPYKVKCLDKRPPHGAKMANVVAKNEAEALKKVRAHGLVPVEINGRSLKEEAETTMKGKDPCWKSYEMIGTKEKNGKEVPNCVPKEEACCDDCADPIEEEAEYEGRKVTLNKPFGGDSKHKRYVYVKNDKGNIIKLGFGDPNMEIKRDDPERLKAYRARHNCSDPGPKWKANYWSCKYWSSTPTSKLDEATTIHLPRKYMHAGSEMEDQVSAAIHKAAGSPKMHSIEFKFGVRFEVERDGKKDQKLTDILRKNLKEESTSNAVYIPMYVQEASYAGNIGMMELAKFYMKANDSEKKKLQDLIKKEMFKQAWKMVQDKTGVKLVGKEFNESTVIYVPSRFRYAEDHITNVIHKAHGSPAMHDVEVSFNNSGKREVHVNGKKHPELTKHLNKTLNSVREDTAVAANSVDGGGVDMNPTGKPKWDKRSKFHIDHMFRRADGTKYQKKKNE